MLSPPPPNGLTQPSWQTHLHGRPAFSVRQHPPGSIVSYVQLSSKSALLLRSERTDSACTLHVLLSPPRGGGGSQAVSANQETFFIITNHPSLLWNACLPFGEELADLMEMAVDAFSRPQLQPAVPLPNRGFTGRLHWPCGSHSCMKLYKTDLLGILWAPGVPGSRELCQLPPEESPVSLGGLHKRQQSVERVMAESIGRCLAVRCSTTRDALEGEGGGGGVREPRGFVYQKSSEFLLL